MTKCASLTDYHGLPWFDKMKSSLTEKEVNYDIIKLP
jgi:hypothetical protein